MYRHSNYSIYFICNWRYRNDWFTKHLHFEGRCNSDLNFTDREQVSKWLTLDLYLALKVLLIKKNDLTLSWPSQLLMYQTHYKLMVLQQEMHETPVHQVLWSHRNTFGLGIGNKSQRRQEKKSGYVTSQSPAKYQHGQ